MTDADGVWTDGSVRVHEDGGESLRFSIRDGLGVRRLLQAGVEIVIVTGRGGRALAARARALGVEEIHERVRDKGVVLAGLRKARGLAREQVAAMGDDLPDLALFDGAALCFAPPGSPPEILARADHVTAARAGEGALREACELLLAARGERA